LNRGVCRSEKITTFVCQTFKNSVIMGSSFYLEENFGDAEKLGKEVVKKLVCPVHGKKARVSFDYDNSGNNAYITKCCCPQFANCVKDAILQTNSFHVVKIEDEAFK
jgi:hypothetical protein